MCVLGVGGRVRCALSWGTLWPHRSPCDFSHRVPSLWPRGGPTRPKTPCIPPALWGLSLYTPRLMHSDALEMATSGQCIIQTLRPHLPILPVPGLLHICQRSQSSFSETTPPPHQGSVSPGLGSPWGRVPPTVLRPFVPHRPSEAWLPGLSESDSQWSSPLLPTSAS